MGKQRTAYTTKEKLAAIKFAEAHGNRAAQREFGINESNIREWRKKKDRLAKLPKSKMADRGSKAHHPELEEELMAYVTDRRRRGVGVSTRELRKEAKKIAKRQKITTFGGSVNWVYAFLRRHNLSIRRRTHIAQKLPGDYEDKLTEFQQFIIRQRKQHDYDLSQIGNADQTPLTFDMPYNTTVDTKGAKSVQLNTTGNEKNRFTVMLACTADGGKLPPYVIFKRKTLPKVTWPAGIIVRCQDKGWMDDTLTKDWIKTVWGKRPGGLSKKSLLVLDSFRCHKSAAVKQLLRDSHRTRLAIIPGGMTSMLQPLDVSVNKPMKVMLQEKWNDWYGADDHEYTKTGRMKKVELQDICQWIVDAWSELDPHIIVKAFKKCCISNNMDGTEDDALWEHLVQSRQTSTDDADNAADDDEEVDFSAENDMYRQIPDPYTEEEYQRLWASDDNSDDEFAGFEEMDVVDARCG